MANYHFIGVGAVKRTGNTGGPGRTMGTRGYSMSPSQQSASQVKGATRLGGAQKGGDSVSNDINRFTSTAKSRGPYNGPSSRSISNVYKTMQTKDTSSISSCATPSGGNGSRYTGNAKSSTSSGPDRYNVMTENRMPADASRSVKNNGKARMGDKNGRR